ncbi:rod shape-determining protein MreC [Desulfobacterales bacterium HSG2]|nr:rod shape-determining protein MreC [Desulfobacterales bacterium HSG2]
MFSRKTVIIVGAILLVVVCITGLSVSGKHGYSSYGSGFAIFFIGPFQEVATDSIQFVKDIWNHYFFLVSVAKANDRFKKALSRAIEKNNRCNEIELSNSRLRNLLNFRKTMNEEALAAKVISKDPCPWFKSIIIDKGSTDGIEKGMPVVIPEGIAGLITDVSYFYSKVLLVIDQNSAVDALVQRTRARGIIKGDADRCFFKYVLRKHVITEGDIVVSSGLDGVFPKGLRVGNVSGVTRSNAGIFQEVIVTPFADFEKLEEVLVVLDTPEHNANDEQFASEQN